MTKKVYGICKKCKCEKIENSDKLCESCKRKRDEFVSDMKKIGGTLLGVVLAIFGGRKFIKK